MATHREIIYVRMPDGMPDEGCFRLVEAPLARPADGQVSARIHFLSSDPDMRRQMGGVHGQYAKPLTSGDIMICGAGVVVESRHPNFQAGDRAVLPYPNVNGRMPICGQISQYNCSERQGLRNASVLLDKCVKLQGFRIGRHRARREALDQLMDRYRAGRRKFRETVAQGLEAAPAALINMLSGGNIGKQLVRLAAAAE